MGTFRVSPVSLRLSLAFGGLLSWAFVLSFLGPLVQTLVTERAVALGLTLGFLGGHALGLFVIPAVGREERLVRFARPALMLCALLTPLSVMVPEQSRVLLFLLLGGLSAPFSIAVGVGLVRAVPEGERTRVTGIAAVCCSSVFYLLGAWPLPPLAMLTIMAIVALGASIAWPAAGIRPQGAIAPFVRAGRMADRSYLLSFAGFEASVFFAVGMLLGLTYPSVLHAGSEPPVIFVASVVAVLSVAALAEGSRRYVIALLAPLLLGVSLSLFIISDDCSLCMMVRGLTRVGVIFAGIFLWTTLADLAVDVGERRAFAVGLVSVVASLALGLAIGRMLGADTAIGRLVGHGVTVTALLTAGAISPFVISRSGWSRPPSPVRTAPASPEGNSELDLGNGSETSVDFSAAGSNEGMASRLKRFGLSDRELDVALLLLNGQKWDEIADTLGISRNTLKSHVRSIYRKTGARNRQELLLQTFAHPADDQR